MESDESNSIAKEVKLRRLKSIMFPFLILKLILNVFVNSFVKKKRLKKVQSPFVCVFMRAASKSLYSRILI